MVLTRPRTDERVGKKTVGGEIRRSTLPEQRKGSCIIRRRTELRKRNEQGKGPYEKRPRNVLTKDQKGQSRGSRCGISRSVNRLLGRRKHPK